MRATRAQIRAGLKAVLDAAAAAVASARVLDRPARPEDLARGQVVFILDDPDPVEEVQTLGRRAPFYRTERYTVEVAAAETEAALEALHEGALAALDAALEADRTLGGLAKGLDWALEALDAGAPEGACAERAADIAIDVEYETGSRLAV